MFADYAFERYVQQGLPPHIAAAVVGAFQQESGADLDPMAVHDDGTGFGIAGWRDPEPGKGRKTNLMKWAQSNELDPEDIDTQLDYFLHEITEGDEKAVGEKLLSARDLNEATDAMVHYERPQGYDQNDVTKANGYENRLNNAKALFTSYTGEDALAAGEPTETHNTAPLPEEAEPDLELEPYPEDDEEDFDDESVGEGQTDTQRAGQAIYNAGRKMQDQSDEPLDYTPAGENVEMEELPDSGIPVDAYQQFTSLYADGGVVGEMDSEEFFKMLGV